MVYDILNKQVIPRRFWQFTLNWLKQLLVDDGKTRLEDWEDDDMSFAEETKVELSGDKWVDSLTEENDCYYVFDSDEEDMRGAYRWF